MKEEWKDIKGYEGKYQVSNLGRVYSFYKKDCLKPGNSNGYFYIDLCKNGVSKSFRLHRLVALHFIPNPNNYKEVNHKDEDKTNNKVENLEWCTREYNLNYGTRNKRQSEKLKGQYKGSKHPQARKVQCITTGKKFNTVKEAAEFYCIYDGTHISACCKGKLKSAGKHPITGEKLVWRYLNGKNI